MYFIVFNILFATFFGHYQYFNTEKYILELFISLIQKRGIIIYKLLFKEIYDLKQT